MSEKNPLPGRNTLDELAGAVASNAAVLIKRLADDLCDSQQTVKLQAAAIAALKARLGECVPYMYHKEECGLGYMQSGMECTCNFYSAYAKARKLLEGT